MAKYNFKPGDTSYSLDMTDSLVANYFTGDSLSVYEDADFYGYATDYLTPTGSSDTGMRFERFGSTYKVLAVPKRRIYFDTENSTIVVYKGQSWSGNFWYTGGSSGSSWYGGTETGNKGFSARRLLYYERMANLHYHYNSSNSDVRQQGIIGGILSNTKQDADSVCPYYWTITAKAVANTYNITFTMGEGVYGCFTSTSSSAVGGLSSGATYVYAYGRKVYLYGYIGEQYKAPSGWVSKGNGLYLIGSIALDDLYQESGYDFGTINAIKVFEIIRKSWNGAQLGVINAQIYISSGKGTDYYGSNMHFYMQATDEQIENCYTGYGNNGWKVSAGGPSISASIDEYHTVSKYGLTALVKNDATTPANNLYVEFAYRV